MTTKQNSQVKEAQAPADTVDVQALQNQVLELQQALSLLRFQAEAVEKQKFLDPDECARRAREVVRKSREPTPGKFLCRVYRNGLYKPIEFYFDSDVETYVISEFERRVGTRFVRNRQNEELNDKLEIIPAKEAKIGEVVR